MAICSLGIGIWLYKGIFNIHKLALTT